MLRFANGVSQGFNVLRCTLWASLLLVAGFASSARAADYQNLAVVKPVVSCDQLAKAELGQAVGAGVTIKSAAERDTEKGKYCKVTGTIAPAVSFEVDLPLEHWTQRFLEGGCGGMCGTVSATIGNAGSCMPALNGEFVVAGDDMGHSGGMGAGAGPMGSFGSDPDARIDFAYRANHETTLAAKALIKAFYGQPQKFSYFVGCSDGGREALAEAERYPDDFDGISAGAPVLAISVHNSFFHGWEGVVDKRADGSPILLKSRLTIAHDAIVAHCPTLSGVQDGLLENPFACKFDPKWVQCADGATDTSKCLTAEETTVLARYYVGPADEQGRAFTFNGYTIGSELQWGLPNADTGDRSGPGAVGGMASGNIRYLLMPKVLTEDEYAKFAFNEEWFSKVNEVGAPLYNAGNTNLRPFQAHGGKLIVWHGLVDESMPTATTIAFYQGVQKQLGDKLTDSFMRLFLIPGVGHCGGGPGFPQIDTLSPLMAWTEMKQAPTVIVAGRPAAAQRAPVPIRQGGPGAPAGAIQAGGPGGPGGGRPPAMPYAQPAQPTIATRPVYAYPMVALYKGSGDQNDAANFEPVKVPETLPLVFNTEESKVIGPDNQKFYHAENGVVVANIKK